MTGTSFRHKSWICCRLRFKGRRRSINAPGRYTELFFLDEATAMAAGHRPCAECRRADYDRFKEAWRMAACRTPDDRLTAVAIDERLHVARIDRCGRQITHAAPVDELPDGVFVELREQRRRPLLLWRKQLYPWSHSGYGSPGRMPAETLVQVLTPLPIVDVMQAGYVPSVSL